MMIHTQGKKFKKHSKIRVISNSSFHPIPRKVCFSSYRQLPKSCGDNYTCDVQYGSWLSLQGQDSNKGRSQSWECGTGFRVMTQIYSMCC